MLSLLCLLLFVSFPLAVIIEKYVAPQDIILITLLQTARGSAPHRRISASLHCP